MPQLRISEETSGGAAQLTDLVRIARDIGGGDYGNFKLTLQAIQAALNIASPENFIEKYSDGNTIGDGSTTTLAAAGYNLADAQAAFPSLEAKWGINIAVHTVDTAALFEAMASHVTGKTHVKAAGSTYMLGLEANEYIVKPERDTSTSSNDTSKMFVFDGNGAAFNLLSGAITQNIFHTEIADQTEAEAVVGWKNVFRNFTLRGRSGSTGKGIRLCASTNPTFQDITVRDLGVGIEMRFCIMATIMGCKSQNCDIGFFAGIGDWSGAGNSISGGQPKFYNCFANIPAGGTGFHIDRMDSASLIDCGVDTPTGVEAVRGLYLTDGVSTVAKNCFIKNFRIEGEFSEAAIVIHGQDHGCIEINGVFSQRSNYLLELHLTGSSSTVVLRNICDDFGKLKYRADTGNGGVFKFDNVKLPGNPNTAQEIVDSTDIWETTGGFGPPDVTRVEIISLWKS